MFFALQGSKDDYKHQKEEIKMRQLLMALVVTAFAFTNAEAQTKKAPKPQEKCAISKDQKYITCCKTSLNPAYNINGKTAATTPKKKHVTHKRVTKTAQVAPKPKKTYYVNNYQVCKDEGGYYTCCLYDNTTTEVTPGW